MNRRMILEGWTGSTDLELGEKIDKLGELCGLFIKQHTVDEDETEKYEELEILTDDVALDNVWVIEAACKDLLEYIKEESMDYSDEYEDELELRKPAAYMKSEDEY